MSTIDQLARRLKKALTLHRKWANEARRVKQELDAWEQENGTGDAVWHLLLWELSLAVRQQVFCRDLSRHLHDKYRSARQELLASVFPPDDDDNF